MGPPNPAALNPQRLPLSLSQHEVWLDQRAWPGSAHLNIGGGAYITGSFDLGLFKLALKRLVAENDVLRMAPLADGGQLLLGEFEPVLEIVDLSETSQPQQEMRFWWSARIAEPFVLDGRPLWRFTLLRGSEVMHGLTIQFHHLVMDGWGTSLVMRRWSEIYNELAQGTALLSPGSRSYADFIDDSNIYRSSAAFERDAAYWMALLPELPAPLIERRYEKPKNSEHALPQARMASQTIARADYDHLMQIAAVQGQSTFNFFLAALAVYFARVSHRSHVVVGVPSLNRGGRRFKDTLGMFVGVLPISLHLTPQMSGAELLSTVATAMRCALRHPRYPLSELGRHLQVVRNNRDGIFDVLLSFERQDYALNFGEAQLVQSRQLFSGLSRYPLGITVCEFDTTQDLELVLEGSSACFAAEEVDLLGRRLWQLVQKLAQAPHVRVGELPVLPDEERWALTEGLHKDVASHNDAGTFIALFEHQVALRPEAVALLWNDSSIDYRELDARANHLAHRLVALGAGPGTLVALALPRSPEMVVSVLAIAKAGAAFLPLDPDAPRARFASILAQSAAIALLISAVDIERLGALHASTVGLSWADAGRSEVAVANRSPRPDDLAYVLFTSGSTGTPKGVMVEHRALSVRLAWLTRAYAVDWRDRSAQATQLTFDPSLIELCLPLIHGASVALAPPGRLLPESLVAFAIRHAVTIMAFVPSTLSRFLAATAGQTGLKLRVACCGGEVLSPDLANRFIQQTDCRLFNVYGPTETTIFATAWECELHPLDTPLPIGRPIDDTRIYVLDANLQLLPFGTAGEIFIGGDAVARGYLNAPELDADVFLPDPFQPGKRMYRTGDRGWLGSEGNFYFVGRLDRQVKLRGYRIELGEVESALLALDGVTQAAAKLVQRAGKPMICAWVGSPRLAHHSEDLQRQLRGRLPDYMVPSAIVVQEALPTNTTDKIDYTALLEFPLTASPTQVRAPRNQLERDLLKLWHKALPERALTVHDNFFDMGGDSLAAIEVLSGIEKLLGRKVPMYLIAEHPDVERLAVALADERALPGMLIPLTRDVDAGTVPLFIAASGHGDLLRLQNLARAVASVFSVHMLQPPMGMPVASISDLAEKYVDCIESLGLGACFIAGFSVGGVAALETARVMRTRNLAVRGLVLIDTIYPKAMFGGTASWRMLVWLVRNLHIQELSMNGRRLGAMFNDPGLVGQVMALKGYRPAEFELPATFLVKSSGLASWDTLFFRAWRRLIGPTLKEFEVPGLHGSIFETSNVSDLAAALTTIHEFTQ